MSATARNTRSRRGRLLVVSEKAPSPQQLSTDVDFEDSQAFVRVNNLFDALGQVMLATAARPIAAVVLLERMLSSEEKLENAVLAIRKIDPSVRIVMAAESPDRWEGCGIDEYIELPISADDLNHLLDDDLFDDGAVSHQFNGNLASLVALLNAGPAAKSEPAGKSASMLQANPSPPPDSATHPYIDNAAMPVAPSNFSHTQPRTPIEIPAPPVGAEMNHPVSESEALGDIDLVEAVLTAEGAVREIALRLIVQQTKWTDLALAQRVQDIGEVKSAQIISASVQYKGAMFGVIHTALAKPADLQPWADWLAHWLNLDRAFHANRLMSYQDDLTSAGNRRFFDHFLNEAINRAAKARRPVTLMVFDIDNFKTYNDQFGHDAGDDILRESVRLMQTVIRQGDRVCRIGGDEFAVIFADDEAPREPGSKHPESVETIAKRFQDQICKMHFPKLGSEAPGTLTISAGLATYPWDGSDSETLLRHADQLALESKRKGKNLITFGLGAMRVCRPER